MKELIEGSQSLREVFTDSNRIDTVFEVRVILKRYWDFFIDRKSESGMNSSQFLKREWSSISISPFIQEHTPSAEIETLLQITNDDTMLGYKIDQDRVTNWVSAISSRKVPDRETLKENLVDGARRLAVEGEVDYDIESIEEDSVALTIAVLEQFGDPVLTETQLELFAIANLSKAVCLFEDERLMGKSENIKYDPFPYLLRANQLINALGKLNQ